MTSLTMLKGDLVRHVHGYGHGPSHILDEYYDFTMGMIVGFNSKSLLGMKGFEVVVLRSDGRIVCYPSIEIRVVSDACSGLGT